MWELKPCPFFGDRNMNFSCTQILPPITTNPYGEDEQLLLVTVETTASPPHRPQCEATVITVLAASISSLNNVILSNVWENHRSLKSDLGSSSDCFCNILPGLFLKLFCAESQKVFVSHELYFLICYGWKSVFTSLVS